MPTPNPRRSDYDVTNTVQVSSTADVREAVGALFAQDWPDGDFAPVARSFDVFERFFAGQMPGYHGVDTVYHDRQHTLDIALAFARLAAGYERQAAGETCLGAERTAVGIIVALFHDIGYLRRKGVDTLEHGAGYTRVHVARGAGMLEEHLPLVGLAHWVAIACEVIHFTGYEVPLESIAVSDQRDRTLGHLLGTADMIAQMADRCYLEKCRDRLYPEFVLGGMALPIAANGGRAVKYASGLDLLRQTPEFMAETRRQRLDVAFGGAYRYLEALFDGHNPYMEAIERNAEFLRQVLRSESWHLLRRSPPVFVEPPEPLARTRGHMLRYLKKAWSTR
ncbi:MAG: hypothetical protein IPI06_13235 [Gammaproteobacteria bacterium]|nr:hypothetical protein [Gammaproteobacteria bacterium]